MGIIKPGVIVFATDDSRAGIEAAREWLKEKGLTPDCVRLFRHDGMTLVETLRPCEIGESPLKPKLSVVNSEAPV